MTHLFSNGGKFFFFPVRFSLAPPMPPSVARFPLPAATASEHARRPPPFSGAPWGTNNSLPLCPPSPLALFCRPARQSFGSVMGTPLCSPPPPPPPALPPSPLHGLAALGHRAKREKSRSAPEMAVSLGVARFGSAGSCTRPISIDALFRSTFNGLLAGITCRTSMNAVLFLSTLKMRKVALKILLRSGLDGGAVDETNWIY